MTSHAPVLALTSREEQKQYTLLTEVRELIRPTDVHQFDELIYNKSTSFRVSTNSTITTTSCTSANPMIPTSIYQNNNNNAMISSPPPSNQMMMQQPQQQTTAALSPPPREQGAPPPPPPHIMHHHNMQGQDLGVDEIVDDFIENPNLPVGNMNEMVLSTDCNGPFPPPWRNNTLATVQQNNTLVQPPTGGVVDSRQLLITHDPAALQISHPQVLNVLNPSTNTQGMQPTRTAATASTVVTTTALPTTKEVSTIPNVSSTGASSTVPAVRFKVRINKVKPILGIAIEGGSNTPHRLPRIIDVNPDGSAFHSNLRAGQVLLTVDGKKLDGLTHEEIARLILDCYVDMTKSQIEFLVVEAKQNYYYFNSHQNI
ncbi:unnamed protein product [Orchesella dallaii]|uniref:PDZ domain-containing protein n=1 Tax=Orchesella dallaii TaxID=48710 RepID=A0ABP1QWK8_9HEXA